MELEETLLPGVGVRYELTAASGQALGIVVQRDGAAEISVYDARDRDRATGVFRLDPQQADAVAEVLGAPRLTQRFADLSKEVPGLESGRLAVAPGSPFAGHPLGDTRARTLTGCSIVAVVRGADVLPSPGPDQVLQAGDVLVAIGSGAGLADLDRRLSGRD